MKSYPFFFHPTPICLKNVAGIRLWRNGLIGLIAICMTAVLGANAAYSEDVLILYDSSGPYGHVGRAHTMLLENLLGHFEVKVVRKPVSEYSPGDIAASLATFYLGALYDEAANYAPESDQMTNYNHFLEDASHASKPLVWLNYNLWWLADYLQKNGRSFNDIFGFTVSGVWNEGYNRVTYKDTELFKGVVPHANPGANLTGCTDEGDGKWACSTELNGVDVTDHSRVRIYATTHTTIHPDVNKTPYVIRSGNFWFVGDLPTVHISEEDRYLVLADLLHDMLGIHHEENHRALVRLEDVSAKTNLGDLKTITRYLRKSSIPFAVSVIPVYADNAGAWQPISRSRVGRHLSQISGRCKCSWHSRRHCKCYARSWRSFDRRCRHHCRNCRNRRANISIVAHGYTHQSDFQQNPYNGISGDDFEFYRVTDNPDNSLNFHGPLPVDVNNWAADRMRSARRELKAARLRPFAWSAPHYIASSRAYEVVHPIFPLHYGRITYFLERENVIDMHGQFFPYPIEKDRYGYQVVPENIGYYEPEPISGYRPLYPEDLIRHARKNLVVRDGYASFFYHPPLGVTELQQIVEGIQSLGYKFVAPKSVF